MDRRQEHSFCRICNGICGVVVDIDNNGRIDAVRGDKNNPLSHGFACIKGIEAPAFQYHCERLLHPLARQPDGSFRKIPLEDALTEIAVKVRSIVERTGPNSIATFRGTQNHYDSVGFHMLPAWMKALGSRSFFTTMTIDQSAKWVTKERLGSWSAGYQAFADADVWMLVGLNPLVSLWGGNGGPMFDPVKQIKRARARGMKLIVIDSRLSETARLADLFIQPLPGEDVTIAAGLLKIILDKEWHDRSFCNEHVNGLAALRTALSPFTQSYVAARAGVSEQSMEDVASAFAHTGQRGMCAVGTGPSMAPHSNLADHLYECLNVVCNRFLKAGEPVPNPGVMSPRVELRAEVTPPRRPWEHGPKGRSGRGLINGEMMTGTLADEILLPGTDQIRAMFVVGGNPASVLPNQSRALTALNDLELLVTIDPMMTATAKASHYILPPLLQYERCDVPFQFAERRIFSTPYAQFTPAIVDPPEGAEVVDDWYVFWSMAKHLSLDLIYFGKQVDVTTPPTREMLLQHLLRDAAVSWETLCSPRSGAVFNVPQQLVSSARADARERFELAPADIVAEIDDVLGEVVRVGAGYEHSHLLISRRMREVSNTQGHDLPGVRERVPFNPAWLNPADMDEMGILENGPVEISSSAGAITGVARADATVRRGVVSMTHGWGGSGEAGVSTSILVSTDTAVELINAMPRMSAVPVQIRAVPPLG